jgi:NAD(P)-dependent dehydrogenase (short-subunit alcohol dehydrogenase family)
MGYGRKFAMKLKLKPLNDQVIVVMGASSGIGRETALRLARRGARVVASARSVSGLNSLVDEIESSGGQAIAVAAEVTNFQQVKAVANRTVEKYGQLDTWVHLAAISLYATFEQTTPEEFKRVIDVNLVGQAYGAMAALPYLREKGGALIHVSSVEAERALPLQSAYAASKHGVKGMLEAMRQEFAHDGLPISVTNIMPATINTPFFEKARTKLGVEPKGIPPFYAPNLVARAILYAAEHPVRDIAVGDAARLLINGQRLSPRLMDAVLRRIGPGLQRTDEPKSVEAPDNMWSTTDGPNRVEGRFERYVQPSPLTALQLRPALRWALTGGALGGAVLLVRRLSRHA